MSIYTKQQDRAVAGLSTIWTPKKGEIEKIVQQQENARQQAENDQQQEENARQQEIVQQQIVARQQELDQENAYYQAQMRNISRNMSPPPTYFMTTPNGTIHYYY